MKAIMLAVVATAALALTSPAMATAPGANGKIYFSARVDGASNDNQILSINADGTGLTNVTPPSVHVPFEFDGDNSHPTLTGDGSRFVWLTDRCWDTQPTPYCGTNQIGLANADGGAATRLTDLSSSDQRTPSVSPDGTKVAFASDRNGCCEILVEDLATGTLTQVTHTGQTNTSDPTFSPTGEQLAYDSNGHVWVLDLGSGITVDVGGGGQPTWSPDGTQLAYVSGRTGSAEIWRSNLDGSDAVQLTFLGCNESNPSWSPDGLLIVFHSNCDGGLDIASAIDGSKRHMLIGDHTPYPAVGEPELPDWQTSAAAPLPPDTTPPTIHCDTADVAWHADNVSIACTAMDDGSGLANAGDASFSLTTSVPAGSETADATTDSRSVCDVAGNCATAGPIGGNRVDREAPSISCGSPDGIWHAGNVTIACNAADGGAGLANPTDASFSLSTSVPAGSETANAATNSRLVCDNAGNCATAGPISGNLVDRSPPTLTLPASLKVDATSPLGATVTYAVNASDGTDPSPVLTCTPASGSSFAIGTTNVACTAADHAGNTSTGTFTVTVEGATAQIVDLVNELLADIERPALSTPFQGELQAMAKLLIQNRKALACTYLTLFIDGVKRAPSSVLTAAQSQQLIADATRIRAVIGC